MPQVPPVKAKSAALAPLIPLPAKMTFRSPLPVLLKVTVEATLVVLTNVLGNGGVTAERATVGAVPKPVTLSV